MSTLETEPRSRGLGERIRSDPEPATVWAGACLLLLSVQFGAVFQTVRALFPGGAVGSYVPAFVGAPVAAAGEFVGSLPTLLTRDVIPNQGYRLPGQGWQETFLGLEPAVAWLVRVALIYVYSLAWLALLWWGYRIFRSEYRAADWTPMDDKVARFRSHYWGISGVVVVFFFVVMAVFAPAMGPTTVERNIQEPFSYEVSYFDEEAGSVATETVGTANFESGSSGTPEENVGPLSYDDYGRFHPIGTLPKGNDMFTFMAAGARISLSIALLSIGISVLIGVGLAVFTAYYKGLSDLVAVIASDSVQAIPQLLLLILLASLLRGTWLGSLYNGAAVLTIIFAATNWPYLWRAIRGPALQIAENEWIDASRSFGQRPRRIMQKHMVPYVTGYMLIYASLSIGGIIISVAGLSYLGLGISAPTPEWGRAVRMGQDYVTTASWHISLIPGVMIVLLVTAFNAFGDGVRDALDPQAETEEDAEIATAGGSGA